MARNDDPYRALTWVDWLKFAFFVAVIVLAIAGAVGAAYFARLMFGK